MNPILQSGIHPDANTLTAFTEQLLPAPDREQVLAHMAVCSRCREVVFLAQQAAVEEPVMELPAASAPKKKARWWNGWRLAWIPAGALAVLIGVVAIVQLRRTESKMQMARNASPSEGVEQSTAQQVPPPPSPTATREVAAARKAAPDIALLRDRKAAPMPKAKDALDAEEKKADEAQKQFSLGAAAPVFAPARGLSSGAVHGVVTPRAQSSSYGGPMANNQFQQNASQQQQNLAQQNATQQNRIEQNAPQQPSPSQPQQNPGESAADKTAVAEVAPSSVNETVTVSAAPIVEPNRAPPASSPPVQLSYTPLAKRSLGLSDVATAQLKKTEKVALPNGAQPLSVATVAGRIIALDTSGALFLSEDQGGHWTPVLTQWTGKAVLVRNMPAEKGQIAALQAKPSPRFELVNDKLQTWLSVDGKTWTAKPMPNQ